MKPDYGTYLSKDLLYMEKGGAKYSSFTPENRLCSSPIETQVTDAFPEKEFSGEGLPGRLVCKLYLLASRAIFSRNACCLSSNASRRAPNPLSTSSRFLLNFRRFHEFRCIESPV